MIVVDVETTGLDPQKHSIISIGALELEKPKNQFYSECNVFPGAEISDYALKINGSTREEIAKRDNSLEDSISDFLSWADKCSENTLAGQNPAFDRDFLRASAKRYSIPFWPFSYRTVDLHSLCYASMLSRGVSIEQENGMNGLNADLCLAYCGLPSEPKPHKALNGAKYEAEAFYRLIFGLPLLDEFKQYQMPDYLVSECLKCPEVLSKGSVFIERRKKF